MKLFTKDIDKKLFEQYSKGSDLNSQMVVAKIFNPYGRGTWYLINSDPEDPDYIWAISDLFEIEVGSVSRQDLENVKFKPFMLGLERDMYFEPVSAMELYKGLKSGKQYAEGGNIESENSEMVKSYNKQIAHHTKEMTEAMNKNGEVPAWVVAKMTRSASDLSDATHYMEGKGEEYAKGGDTIFMQGGVLGDVFSIKDTEQFRQVITVYNELSEKFGVSNYFIDHKDNSVIFLMESNNKTADLNRYVNSLHQRGFDIFDKTQDVSVKKDNGKNSKYYFKLNLSKKVEYAKGGGVGVKNGEKFKVILDTNYGIKTEPYEAIVEVVDDDINSRGQVTVLHISGKMKGTKTDMQVSSLTDKYAKGGGVRAKKQYNKEVDAYKFFVVDLENKKAVSGWEFKEDAKDALSDYDGDKNFKVVAESTLKAMGIENPKEQWKMENGGGVGSNKWQIKNSDGKYFSRNLQSGKPAWNDSPDMGYTFSKSEAEKAKQGLSNELGLNDLEVVEYNPNWWMMENGGGVLNYDFLIGKWVAMYIMGVKEPQYYTIKSVKATPEKYTNKDLIISFDLMTEERIPLTKVDSFLNGEQVELRDSSGEYYVLQLQKEYAKGGGVGFIPMDLEADLANVAKFGGTNIKGVIGILNAMIDSGLTDSDLKTAPTKTSAQYAKAKEKKTEEIWKKIKSNYKGDFEGNMYYSTIYRLVEIANDGDEILKKFKPFRKNQEFAKGGGVGDKKEMKLYRIETLASGNNDVLTDRENNLYIYEKGVLYDTEDGVKKGVSHRMSKINLTILPFKEYAKGGATPAQKKKIGKVMHEFKEGTLHSGKSDKVVKNPKQAVAIALSEAGLSKKESGGAMGWKSRMKNWKKK